MAAPFISTMTGTLDAKGRVCIPSTFRDVLTAQGSPTGVHICPSFAGGMLEGFGEELLQVFHQMTASLDPFFTPEHDERAYAVLSRVQFLPRDENGRVRLPDEFIAHAGLQDRVTFVGLGRKFQIWDSGRFAAREAEWLERARARRDANGGQP